KSALKEAARFYVELQKLGAGLKYLDVGGGLAVDYDGSNTNFDASMNYSMQEYANDVVFQVMEVCDEAGVEHPNLVSESGRALTAHHSVLKIVRTMPLVPEELDRLERSTADTYFCNFSLFQSVPDHWAINHLFPILPIHRLNERPSRRGVLADITCDSDGKIEHFIDLKDV